jgi:heme exporter protein B
MLFLHQCLAVARKDILLEVRTRYSLAATLAFLAASHLLLGLAIDASLWSPSTRAGLFWMLVIFSLLVGIGRLFSAETERHTSFLLQTALHPDAVFTGKFAAHVLYALPVVLLANALFYILFNHIPVHAGAWLLLNTLSLLSFAALFTLLSAVASGAGVKGSVFAVLSIPLQIPLMLLLVRCSRYAYSTGWLEGSWGDFLALGGFFGTIFTAGFLLFDAAWES